MVKVSSRDILGILRHFEMAGEENVPRHIESIKITHPNPINTLASFRFAKSLYFVLFDDTAEDDAEYVMKQIKTMGNSLKGELLKNPKDIDKNYAIPYKGKECYLFVVISDKKRLDSELAKRYPDISRSTWQKYIKAGYVSVDGKVIDQPKADITDIDNVAINMPDKPDFTDDKLPIIYIDDNIIVVNKPIGVLSHSKGAMNDEFTVADFFRSYTTYSLDTNRPGIIHRLDRDTSGVMIGARNAETATLLQKQFADRKTKKTYLAIVEGVPNLTKANIDLPIGRNPSKPSTFRVGTNGKNALTKFEVLSSSSDEKCSLVKLQPKTGRTHQLRVHMQYIKNPILGDKVYGSQATRLFLHALSLEITIPGGERKTFAAPIPESFLEYFPKADILNETAN